MDVLNAQPEAPAYLANCIPGCRRLRLGVKRMKWNNSPMKIARSKPEEFGFTSTDFNSYVTVSTADGAPRRANGFMTASTEPGLGVHPKLDVLGPRVVEVA